MVENITSFIKPVFWGIIFVLFILLFIYSLYDYARTIKQWLKDCKKEAESPPVKEKKENYVNDFVKQPKEKKSEKTFSDLKIPFPLFEASVDEAEEYCGIASCDICHSTNNHCFNLGIGCAVIVECPSCKKSNGLDADDKESQNCYNCEKKIEFPIKTDDEYIKICYSCLRDAKGTMAKNTEYGLIYFDSLQKGIVDNSNLNTENCGFDYVLGEEKNRETSDGTSYRVRNDKIHIPKQVIREIITTPNYKNQQEEYWYFCCKNVMTYIGQWEHEDFTKHAPDKNDEKFFYEIINDKSTKEYGFWNKNNYCGTLEFYIFHCKKCGKYKGHCEFD